MNALTRQDELMERGRAARTTLHRRDQGLLVLPADRDPMGVLEQQHAQRLPELISLRLERMLANPFAFYRGTAALQAADLSNSPVSGPEVVLCGDAHIGNFGVYASPQRQLVFDLNDFDEAAFGPWEWDVKRLITSVVIGARHNGFDEDTVRQAALETVSNYRLGLRQILKLGASERYFMHSSVLREEGLRPSSQKALDRVVEASERRTSERVFAKITRQEPDGSVVIIEDPPTLTHVRQEISDALDDIFAAYCATVSPDIAVLLKHYTPTDAVRRVVGVGSVGTRCYLMMLTGPLGEPLILQFKEATESVLTEFGQLPRHTPPGLDAVLMDSHNGFRVVASQRVLQAVSDPFLGYVSVGGFTFYVRQFRDRNASFVLDDLPPNPFTDYSRACGAVLARGHAQSPDAAIISGYLGNSATFDETIVEWALAYADVSYGDYQLLQESVAAGRFEQVVA